MKFWIILRDYAFLPLGHTRVAPPTLLLWLCVDNWWLGEKELNCVTSFTPLLL